MKEGVKLTLVEACLIVQVSFLLTKFYSENDKKTALSSAEYLSKIEILESQIEVVADTIRKVGSPVETDDKELFNTCLFQFDSYMSRINDDLTLTIQNSHFSFLEGQDLKIAVKTLLAKLS